MTDKYSKYTVCISPFDILGVGDDAPTVAQLCKFAADAIKAGDYDMDITETFDLPEYDDDEGFTGADDCDDFGGFV